MNSIIAAVISYLIGAIPTAYIVGKLYKGIDIREHGSGNVGATNVFRVLGKEAGILVLLIDILKGIIPLVFVSDMLGVTSLWQRILLGIIVVCGHNWTVFLKFKGGKGIATSLGVLIGLTIAYEGIRIVVLLTLLVWIACFLTTGYVSLASIVAASALPLFMLLTSQPFEFLFLGVVFCVFVVLRHRANLKRLLSGAESKVNLPFNKK